MPITHTITQPLSPGGVPTEAVAMSLCETRSALEGLLSAVNALVRLNTEMHDTMEDIKQAVVEGTAKADEGIQAAKEHREELAAAIEELRWHQDGMSELKKAYERDVEARGNNGTEGS